MHNWTLVLEVEVHVSFGFWSKNLCPEYSGSESTEIQQCVEVVAS